MVKTILFLFVTVFSFSQNKDQEHYIYFSGAIDIRNATVGSTPTNNKPAADLLYQFGMVGQNFEVNIGYENFKAIHFDKYSIGIGYHFPLYGYVFGKQIKTVFIPSIEPSLIGRWGAEWQCTSSHLSIGGNLSLRWFLSDKVAIEWLTNFLPRTDLCARYPEIHPSIPVISSNYLKIIYKI